jgi:hypothetical protein
MLSFGPNALKTSWRSASVSLSSDHSSWLRTKFRPPVVDRQRGHRLQAVDQWSGILTHQRQCHGLVQVEVEAHVQLVAALVAEEAPHFLIWQIDLAHQHGLTAPAS